MRFLFKLFFRFTGFIVTAAVLLCAFSVITGSIDTENETREVVALVHEYPGDYSLRILGKTIKINSEFFSQDKLDELLSSITDFTKGFVGTLIQLSDNTPPRSS